MPDIRTDLFEKLKRKKTVISKKPTASSPMTSGGSKDMVKGVGGLGGLLFILGQFGQLSGRNIIQFYNSIEL